jgi:hypothetical protein
MKQAGARPHSQQGASPDTVWIGKDSDEQDQDRDQYWIIMDLSERVHFPCSDDAGYFCSHLIRQD